MKGTNTRNQALHELAGVIKQMPAPLSRVFTLSCLQRQDQDAVAAALNLPVATVLELQTKALVYCTEKLRERFSDDVPISAIKGREGWFFKIGKKKALLSDLDPITPS